MATAKRDLRTGRSVWMARPMPRVPSSRLRRDIDTEVLIVGAALSGEKDPDAGLYAFE